MTKVITFSRIFPKGHPKAGQQTYFVEQVLNALCRSDVILSLNKLIELNSKSIETGKITEKQLRYFWEDSLNRSITSEKLHTIRSGYRWKAGEMASLRVWSGRPYFDPQIIFAPDQEIKQVGDFKIHKDYDQNNWIDIGSSYYHRGDFDINQSILPMVARNDGLSTQDLLDWFKYPKPFEGQIIAWKEVGYV